MPIYEYRCERGHTFDVLQSMSADPVAECRDCGAPVERVYHPVAIHFKGSGFYTTDYGRGKGGDKRKTGEKTATSGGGEPKSGGDSDSGSGSDSGSDAGSGSGTASDSSRKAAGGEQAAKVADAK